MNRGVTKSQGIETGVRVGTREPSEAGKRRILSRPGEPMFLADWERALFLHFEVDPEQLQPLVPFELDLFENTRAFVSLVAFTMRGMHPRIGGSLGAAAFRPIATHPFLNVRTYVRHEGESGIHFLVEWLSNRLACLLGPAVFGLPYQFGKLEYRHDHLRGEFAGVVRDARGQALLEYESDGSGSDHLDPAPVSANSLGEFLVERYTAFTARRSRRGFFRVWHEPWKLCRPRINLRRNDLLGRAPGGTDWGRNARLVDAHYSPGAGNVWMGWPHSIEKQTIKTHAA